MLFRIIAPNLGDTEPCRFFPESPIRCMACRVTMSGAWPRPMSGAQQVERSQGLIDANSATPPHSHDVEEVVLFLTGSGPATVT